MSTHQQGSRLGESPWRTVAVNLVVYIVMNSLFVLGWLPNAGKPLPEGFFWPAIPIVAWGIGLAIYGYRVYHRAHL